MTKLFGIRDDNPAALYKVLLHLLRRGRAKDTFVGTEGATREESILERMDVCWWKMSEEERAQQDAPAE